MIKPEIQRSPILFYSKSIEYSDFSNFANFPIIINNKIWPTNEHYFQAMKFEGSEREETIRLCKSPSIAKKLGKGGNLRSDWEEIKINIMYIALKTKFTQHENLKSLLINTGNRELIERSLTDNFWGNGKNGKGANNLGKLLMRVRSELN